MPENERKLIIFLLAGEFKDSINEAGMANRIIDVLGGYDPPDYERATTTARTAYWALVRMTGSHKAANEAISNPETERR